MDRRTFVQTLSLACGSFAGIWSETTRAQIPSSNEKLSIAAIGVGSRGFDNLLAVNSENIVAICDVDERYLNQASERFPKSDKLRDYRKLFSRTDIDAVVISTPDHSHALPALMSMNAGWHVYCEKPLAHNLYEVRRLAEVASQSRITTQMGNQHHSSAGYRLARRWLEEKVIGEAHEVHAWTNRPNWPQGVRRPADQPPVPASLDWDLWLGPAPERPYHPDYHPLRWRGWWDFGSGTLGDMGPHLLDPVFAGLELGSPTVAWAETSEANDETAPASSIVHFTFAARGVHPALKMTWYDGGKIPDASVTGTRRPPSNGVLVVGDNGKLFIPELGKMPRTIPADLAPKPMSPATENQLSHHEDWIAACKNARQAKCPFAYGAGLTELFLVGNLAIRCAQRIEWDSTALKARNAPEAEKFIRRNYRKGWEV